MSDRNEQSKVSIGDVSPELAKILAKFAARGQTPDADTVAMFLKAAAPRAVELLDKKGKKQG